MIKKKMDVWGAVPKRMKVNLRYFIKLMFYIKNKLLKKGRKREYETAFCLEVSQKSQKIQERPLMP